MTQKVRYILVLMLVCLVLPVCGADQSAYKESQEYLILRDSVHHAFNDGDSARFFVAVKHLQDYLLRQNDLHAYYTQRCNEIVFQLNRQRIFEAYKLATQLSKELTERKLDKEMYMAINMMGHIYRYSGNKESAKQCFWDVIHRMEKEGYTESLPPIYMNLVNIYMDEDPQEALKLIDKAASIANKTSPERVFDIETRRTLAFCLMGDKERFLEGYENYKKGISQGLSSVHGRKLEVYYLAYQGKTEEAAQLAAESEDDPYETQADIYAKAGLWKEAYRALEQGAAQSDSISSVILSSSMQGIQNELRINEIKRQASKRWFVALLSIAGLLMLLVVALLYIVQTRRRHLQEMQKAYQRVLESDNMKTAFIQNVSHEVRTPLNIISGFAQVIADSTYAISAAERKHISEMMMRNTQVITKMVNEVLDMSNVYSAIVRDGNPVRCNEALRTIIGDFCKDSKVPQDTIHYETVLADDFTVDCRLTALQRILEPLLENAVKNLPAEHGKVTVKAQQKDGRLLLIVEDNGCGIPAHESEHIFERFVKLDTFKDGLGLGLTYSRAIARRLDGDVVLDTANAGPGARFKVVV